MALVVSNIFGEMSGKVGGLVFMKSAGGTSVRQYVKGTDAQSLQQLYSRQRFSGMAAMYRSLSTQRKLDWKNYGLTYFVPKHPKPTTVYSGYQAFMGNNNNLNTITSTVHDGVLYSPSVSASYDQFPNYYLDAPVVPFEAKLQDSSGNPVLINLSDAVFTASTGLLSITINMTPGGQVLPVVFQSPVHNVKFGLVAFFSLPFSGGRTTVSSKESYLVGGLGSPNIVSGWTTSDQLKFHWTIPSNYFSSCKYAFVAGHHIFVTVYAVSLTGSAVSIGRVLIYIS